MRNIWEFVLISEDKTPEILLSEPKFMILCLKDTENFSCLS